MTLPPEVVVAEVGEPVMVPLPVQLVFPPAMEGVQVMLVGDVGSSPVTKSVVRVRVVQGDFAAAAADEVDPGRGYLELVGQLAGKVPDLALATHNCDLAREAIAKCKNCGVPVQLELFFGRPASAMLALSRETGVPVGFYVPYGDTLLIYLIRDLLGNPHKLLRRDSFELLESQQTKLARIVGSL